MKEITIFTDGSSRNNPGLGGWGGITVSDEYVVELGGGEKRTTNNRMEMTAVLEVLSYVLKSEKIVGEKIVIYSDSSYVINGITKWIFAWEKNNWKTKAKEDVLNKDIWQKLFDVVNTVENTYEIEWKHVDGHTGVRGNERADKIATAFADGKDINLFKGKFEDYKIDIKNFDVNTTLLKNKIHKGKNTGKAYSYVSFVEDKLHIDKDWKTCESRVKGKSNVKFRKALSKEDEDKFKKEFLK